MQLTSFIGRQEELRDIAALLNSCRLLTLVGAGGIGKTRLAIEVAARIAEQYKHGVFFIPLQGVNSPELFVPTLASILSFQFYEDANPKQQLFDFLGEKELLLVIDNFEHLVAGASLLVEFLRDTTHLKLLVTSREALNLREEWLYQVDGLHYPGSNKDNSDEYSALTLFTERARQVRPDFSLEKERDYVVRICQLVEGMPLAIEMAAAWLKTMPCENIARQIQHSFDFLTSTLRDVPDRHRSIRIVFDHSWQSLSVDEQAVFMKLSIFQGGCTHQAAEAVTGASRFTVSALVDRSLVRLAPSGRLEIHELLRQYGSEQLEQAGLTETVRDTHSRYYLNAMAKHESGIKGDHQLKALDAIDSDFANVRAAWEWAVDQKHEDLLNNALECVFWFCGTRARFQELEALLDHASAASLSERTMGRILARTSHYLTAIFVEQSVDSIEHSLQIAQRYENPREIAYCWYVLAEIAFLETEYEEAQGYYQQALTLYRQLDDPFYTARLLRRVGLCHITQGQLEDSHTALQEGLELARHIGEQICAANCLYHLGSLAGFSGNLDAWERHCLEALELRRDFGDRPAVSVNLGGLAQINFLKGDFNTASRLAEEALEIALDINYAEGKAFAYVFLGMLACVAEDYGQAEHLLEQGRYPLWNPIRTIWVELGLAMVNYNRGNLTTAHENMETVLTYLSKWRTSSFFTVGMPMAGLILSETGQVQSSIEITSFALHHPSGFAAWFRKWGGFSRWEAHLKTELGEQAFMAAWEIGKTLNFDAVVQELLDEFQVTQTAPISERMRAANQNLVEPLTSREHEILLLITQGLSNREIAEQLVIEVSTVKRHINNCYGKLDVRSRTQAVLKAQELQLI